MKYSVQAGDTLSKIAITLLGDMSRWPEIARANNIKSPYIIEIGQILDVPEIMPVTTPTTDKLPVSRGPFRLPAKIFGIDTRVLLIGAAVALIAIPMLTGKR